MGEKDPDLARIDRRKILKTAGLTSGAITLSSVGVPIVGASDSDKADIKKQVERANKERKKLVSRYDSVPTIEEAIQTHAGPLLGGLSSQGIIKDGNLDILPTTNFDTKKTVLHPGEDFEGVGVTSYLGGKNSTALIFVSHHTDHQHVAIFIQPGNDEVYSIITEKEDGKKVYATMDDGRTRFSTLEDECTTSTNCSDDPCHYDEGKLCITVYYPEVYFQCCPDIGCGIIGESSCLEGCSCCNYCPP